jgi:hypothetical protein
MNTPVARLAVDLPEDRVMALLRMALNYASGMTGDIELEEKPVNAPAAKIIKNPIANTANVRIVAETKPSLPEEEIKKPGPAAYKGFLYVKCESCGKTRGFCVKTPIKKHSCECGHTTALEDMKPMTVKCKCGAYFTYLTNITDTITSIDCLKCGAPVDLEYHEKNNEYTTIA